MFGEESYDGQGDSGRTEETSSTIKSSKSFLVEKEQDLTLFSGTNHKLLTKFGIDWTGRGVLLVRGQPNNPFLKVHVGFQTKKGCDTNRKGVVIKKKNQDSLVVVTPLGANKRHSLFGVFDGHGNDGHHASLFIVQNIVNNLKRLIGRVNPVDALKDSIFKSNEDLEKCTKFDVQTSGSTGVMVLIEDGDLYCCNVGDSRCVLGRRRDDGIGEIVPLSYDHKPDRPGEGVRLEKHGGVVQTYTPYDPTGISSSSRVWLRKKKGLGPGLAVARAFGDFLFTSSGVLCKPEILKLPLTVADRFFVIASDGVFSMMSSQEVVDLVFENMKDAKSAGEISTMIVEESKQRWLKTQDGDRDDITCVVTFLENVGGSTVLAPSEPVVVFDYLQDI